MFEGLLECGHAHTTRVFTATETGRTYIVCTDCGTEIEYDLKAMQARRTQNGKRSNLAMAAGLAVMLLLVLKIALL